MKAREQDELLEVPGVGEKISRDLHKMDIHSVRDLKGRDPEELYGRMCLGEGVNIDRCMLYVFRCAVYYASNDMHDPELLKWWNWKDDAPGDSP